MEKVIRLATEADLNQIMPFMRAYHQFENIKLTDQQREEAIRLLLVDRTLGGIWLVYQDEIPVGYIALCFGYSIEFAGRDATIDEFYIMPEYRQKGLGTRVLDLMKEEARKFGIRALHLEVARTNTSAHKLYAKANFTARENYVLMTVAL